MEVDVSLCASVADLVRVHRPAQRKLAGKHGRLITKRALDELRERLLGKNVVFLPEEVLWKVGW